MREIPANTTLLQIQTVQPDGDKLIWLLLILTGIGLAVYLYIRRKKIAFTGFRSSLAIELSKNKIYHPTIISLTIENRSKKPVTIHHPIIRFKKLRKEKAFKIKAVNSSQIYPLYLESGKTHVLPVGLDTFFNFDQKLKKFSRVRIEFKYDGDKNKKTRYLLLKPTFFRKAKR